jgi:hypothetical protein
MKGSRDRMRRESNISGAPVFCASMLAVDMTNVIAMTKD